MAFAVLLSSSDRESVTTFPGRCMARRRSCALSQRSTDDFEALVAAASGGDVSGADLGHLLHAGRRRVEGDATAGVAKPDAVGIGDRMNDVAQRGDRGA